MGYFWICYADDISNYYGCFVHVECFDFVLSNNNWCDILNIANTNTLEIITWTIDADSKAVRSKTEAREARYSLPCEKGDQECGEIMIPHFSAYNYPFHTSLFSVVMSGHNEDKFFLITAVQGRKIGKLYCIWKTFSRTKLSRSYIKWT